jgi:hypothetical protein
MGGGGWSALREAEESGPGQPLGPLGSRRREGYLVRLSGGTGGYWNVVLRLPGSCTISCPKQPPRDLHVSSSGATPDLSPPAVGPLPGVRFRTALRPDGSPLPAGPVERPSGVPRLLFVEKDGVRRSSPPGIADCRRSCPIPVPTIARRPAGVVH